MGLGAAEENYLLTQQLSPERRQSLLFHEEVVAASKAGAARTWQSVFVCMEQEHCQKHTASDGKRSVKAGWGQSQAVCMRAMLLIMIRDPKIQSVLWWNPSLRFWQHIEHIHSSLSDRTCCFAKILFSHRNLTSRLFPQLSDGCGGGQGVFGYRNVSPAQLLSETPSQQNHTMHRLSRNGKALSQYSHYYWFQASSAYPWDFNHKKNVSKHQTARARNSNSNKLE